VTDEYLQSFIELWTAQEPRFEGKFGHVDGVVLKPKPVQKPHPPIWIGGNGTPAMRRAARFGSGWMPLHQTPSAMAIKTRQLKEIVESGERDPKEVRVALGCRFRFVEGAPTLIPDEDSLTGSKRQVIDQLRRYREAGVDNVHLLNDGYSTVDGLLNAWDRFATEVITNVE
jgi:alkanesulfonate monooxygenase SsuD/methylene tetrahydromethanopterin reductase-like flavin-dependent oxidoreductase (luciferase family)